MKICNLLDKKEYVREYAELCLKEWGTYNSIEELNTKINNKVERIINNNDNKLICALALEEDNTMLGFISLFNTDGDEFTELTPWYATMYVKKEYRGLGYSKELNIAILKKAKQLGFDKVYLKSNLQNYYEKFGAKFIETLGNGEKLYYIKV